MGAGRPTVMTEEVVSKLDHGFSMGFSDVEACLFANISKQSLYEYCKRYPKYTDRKEMLKNHPKLLAKTNVVEALKNNKKVEDSKWYLERRAKEFKPKSDLTSDDEPLKQVLVKFISEEPKDETTREDNRDTNRV